MANMKHLMTFLLGLTATVRSQFCAPGAVTNIFLDVGNFLHWSSPTNPQNCTISGYVIDVFDTEYNTEFQFETTPTVLKYQLRFLDMCKNYVFEVRALTNERVLGPVVGINTTTQLSDDMDLRINYITLVRNDSELNLRWKMFNASYARCVSYFRVVYWDENDSPVDVYVSDTKFLLPRPIPCMTYRVQVNAIANAELEGPMAVASVVVPPTVPGSLKLVNMTTTPTAVTMVWKVPSYEESRCQLTELVVVTIGADKTKKVVPIVDSPLRPMVSVIVEGLSPNNVYQSFVSLWNIAGSSKNVTVSFQTSDNYDTN